MQSFTKSGSTYNYIYDEQGLRTRKIAPDGSVTKYLYNGTKLAAEIAPNYRLDFLYDENDMLYGFVKDGSAKYFYARDMLQNILGIIDTNGSPVVIYQYTAYGTSTVLQDTAGLANINPFRFKGYYFDSESGMYYCHTRYYVPEWCRWLNADHPFFLQPDSLQGMNLFAYCGNNPVMYTDPSGAIVISLLVGLAVSFAVGFISSTISQGIQYGIENINFWQSAIDGSFALISTALAATGIGVVGSIVIGATLGLGQYLIDSYFHKEPITWYGALLSISMGAISGKLTGAGARNAKVLANGMTGRAASGMKALTTTINRYGIDSSAYRNVMNLYGKAISESAKNTINKVFTESAHIIWKSTIVASGIQCLIGILF